jgi:hypothetical protein
MKDVSIPRRLAEGVLEQLAAQRGVIGFTKRGDPIHDREARATKRLSDWDGSPLGQLYSMLTQEFSGRRAVPISIDATAASKSNRKKIARRFRK